jgi:hypothetical protein
MLASGVQQPNVRVSSPQLPCECYGLGEALCYFLGAHGTS